MYFKTFWFKVTFVCNFAIRYLNIINIYMSTKNTNTTFTNNLKRQFPRDFK
jgi:hypothetical protein